jgi:hypothetical protein
MEYDIRLAGKMLRGHTPAKQLIHRCSSPDFHGGQ